MTERVGLNAIVGVGASAGGLEALERLVGEAPTSSGVAYVIVQHLSPDFRSMMDDLLRRCTALPIVVAEDGMVVEPNTVYLMPPGTDMIISGGVLCVAPKEQRGELAFPIDVFLRSLAQDAGASAIGVILSGTGSDGSRGICEIHDAGGLVICQSPDTARFDGMPRSALDTAVVDLILAPEEMGAAVDRYVQRIDDGAGMEQTAGSNGRLLERVIDALREESGIDFSRYKPDMVLRRVERRVLLQGATSLAEYVARIERDDVERSALYRDLLIGVTRFFRDDAVFERLGQHVMPQLLEELDAGEELRIWVAGCGTGEEAYSMAILADEAFRARGRAPRVKVFATDVHRASLGLASAGSYGADSLVNVSAARRERYFVEHGDTLELTRELRQSVVFAPHNVIADAPFTRLHLVTCRNLLIYLQPAAQRKALSLFLFGLRRGGVLVLGRSESARTYERELEPISERDRIYRKRRDLKLPADLRRAFGGVSMPGSAAISERHERPSPGLLRTYDALLAAHMPSGLLIADDRSLVHVFPGAARYLRVPEGRPSLDVLDQLVPELRAAIAGALQRVQHTNQKVTLHGLRVNGATIDVSAWRVLDSVHSSPIVVSIDERGEAPVIEDQGEELEPDQLSASRIQLLELELQQSQESLHSTIEELEAANEELQSSNEELVGSNEELQSTNEELQSVNEELYTVNAECQRKIAELTEVSRDMDHLLSSMEVGTLFLDSDLRIRKFTPLAVELFSLEPQDVGRSIVDFRFALDYANLLDDVRTVLGGVRRLDREVKDDRGNWYLLRLRPYLVESEVRGAVLTLIDVAALKAAEERIRNAVARRDEFIAMLSHELRNPLAAIVSAIDLARFKGHGEVALDTRIVSIIDRQSAQMSRILEDLLDISRITRNKLELRREPLDLRAAVEASVDALGSKAERAGIGLELELGNDPIWVDADAGRLQQVVSNLVGNALKYNSPGGHVWVSTGSDGSRATIAVRDDGIGIGEEHLETLFEPFVQSARGMSRSDGGMGVGLSLVRSITELHGGTTTVHSDGPGTGALFEVELPVLASAVASGQLEELRPREPKAAREPTDSEFILLVEDEQDSRELLSALLEQQGYRVRSAADGTSALEIIESSRPSLALIDIGIPKPDGYQVARRAREAYPEVPLVALTGYGRDGDRDESSSSGFDEHLLKPIDMQTLRAVVQRFLGADARPAAARE